MFSFVPANQDLENCHLLHMKSCTQYIVEIQFDNMDIYAIFFLK